MSIIYINPFQFAAAAPAAGLLLDDYPGAAAAYSLRQLRTGVTNVVRVRRSSDSTESNFTATEVSDGTLAAWVGAGNNGFVRTWYDQSGNGYDAIQATAGSRPIIVSSGSLVVSGTKPGVSFNGSTHFLYNGSFTQVGLSSFAAFLVGAATVDFGYNGIDKGGFNRALTTQSYIYDGRYDATNSYLTTGGGTASSYFLGTSLIDGASLSLFVNGSAFANRTFVPPYDGSQGLTIGRISVFSTYSSGTVQEIVLYKISQLSARSAIEANINAHYSIF